MLSLSSAQLLALAKRNVMRRVFVYCWALDSEGNSTPVGVWDDVGNVELSGRSYYGTNLVSVSNLSAKSDMTIPGLSVLLSGISPEGVALVRGHVVAQRPIEVSLGIFDVDSQAMIPPLIRRFIGVVDDIVITTPEAGGKSTIELICESASRALTIKRTETRSSATQNQRDPDDKFYDYTAGQRETMIYFGRKAPPPVRTGPGIGGGTSGQGFGA